MSTITIENKRIARHIADSFNGKPVVREFLHDNLPLRIDILSAQDQPESGVTSYGTIGLSDTPLSWGDGEFPTRIEICCAANSAFDFFPNILASAAFNIMRTGKLYRPGAWMPDYVQEYYKDTKLPHLYFTTPFVWDDLVGLDLETKKVSWLLCFPISNSELSYLRDNGEEKFENLLENSNINIFNIERQSAV